MVRERSPTMAATLTKADSEAARKTGKVYSDTKTEMFMRDVSGKTSNKIPNASLPNQKALATREALPTINTMDVAGWIRPMETSTMGSFRMGRNMGVES